MELTLELNRNNNDWCLIICGIEWKKFYWFSGYWCKIEILLRMNGSWGKGDCI